MFEVNQCDTRCPRTALMAGRYREDSETANSVKKVQLAVAAGACGVGQILRSALCPQRDLSVENWHPNGSCARFVTESVAERPLDESFLLSSERASLKPFLPE